MPRIFDLALELCDHSAEAVQLLNEFRTARGANGRGTHRDPDLVLHELAEELLDIRDTAREARDNVERAERGM